MMKEKLIDAEGDVFGRCKACGGRVFSYPCNADLVAARPQGIDADWWAACSNPDCVHHYGEDIWQDVPEWVVK